MEGRHRAHVLFSGTRLIRIDATAHDSEVRRKLVDAKRRFSQHRFAKGRLSVLNRRLISSGTLPFSVLR
jgi:hypothetical protein